MAQGKMVRVLVQLLHNIFAFITRFKRRQPSLHWRTLFGVGIAFLILISGSWAVPFNEGNRVSLNGTKSSARKELRGVVREDNLIDFEIRDGGGSLVFKGRLQDRVVKSYTTGKLHFYHYIRNTQPGLPGEIIKVSRNGFANFQTDLDYRLRWLWRDRTWGCDSQ